MVVEIAAQLTLISSDGGFLSAYQCYFPPEQIDTISVAQTYTRFRFGPLALQ